MKNLILASILSVVSVSAGAEAISAALGTTATAVTTLQGVSCLYSLSQEECRLAMTSAGIAVIAAVLKEEIVQVQPDAHNFLAGEEISEALALQMAAVREVSEEAATLSDEQLAVAMIQIANM